MCYHNYYDYYTSAMYSAMWNGRMTKSVHTNKTLMPSLFLVETEMTKYSLKAGITLLWTELFLGKQDLDQLKEVNTQTEKFMLTTINCNKNKIDQ